MPAAKRAAANAWGPCRSLGQFTSFGAPVCIGETHPSRQFSLGLKRKFAFLVRAADRSTVVVPLSSHRPAAVRRPAVADVESLEGFVE